ncbi:hypothetical protein TI04_09905 [Achromatium sp. WMS2]|nr:hypothetical protein TI04_09905 [Achromatium sp. WMS2]
MLKKSIKIISMLILIFSVFTPQTTWPATTVPNWVNSWLGYDTSAMTETELDSMICIASALTMGTLITVVGGTAIVIGGHVGRATGTAIALPVLVSSMWSACALSRAITPGILWIHNRSSSLVNKLSGTD